jgi:uncharacterized protein YerC
MPKYSKSTRLSMLHDLVEELQTKPKKTTKDRVGIAVLILQGKSYKEIEDVYGYKIKEKLKTE